MALPSDTTHIDDDESETEEDYETRRHRIANVEKANVKAEILAAIKPYRNTEDEPPFSAAELIVMAVLCSLGPEVNKEQILMWITRTFRYYNEKALEQYCKIAGTGWVHSDMYYAVDDFEEGFSCYDAPLVDPCENEVVCFYSKEVTVPVKAGRVFLRKWLEPARKGKFPFLRLPAELRNTIYEMVFTFPEKGICASSMYLRENIRFCIREVDESEVSRTSATVDAVPVSRILALIRVNKQISREARPYFYRVNCFEFGNMDLFVNFFAKMPASHAEHITMIDVAWSPGEISWAQWPPFLAKALEAFARIKTLSKLEIWAQDRGWFSMGSRLRQACGRTSKFTKVKQFPGVKELTVAASKARVLEFSGDCPQIEAYIREEVKKLKAADNAGDTKKKLRKSAKSKKRISDEDIYGQVEEQVSLKKKAKTKVQA